MTRPSVGLRAGLVALALLAASCGGESNALPPTEPTLPQDGSLAGELDAIRARHGMPALAAFSVHEGRIVESAAVGLRALGHPEGATLDDRWHLGSLTNAGGDPAFAATDEAVQALIRRFDASALR